MHFSVLVIGDDVEGQLAPHSEQLTGPEWSRASDDLMKEIIRIHGPVFSEEDILPEAWKVGAEEVRIAADGTVELGSSFNPDGRWDWWVVGGRWSGVLPTAEGQIDPESGAVSGGVSHSTIGEVLWNEQSLQMIHSILHDGTWTDLQDPGQEAGRPSLMEQFQKATGGLPPETPVHIIDCHV